MTKDWTREQPDRKEKNDFNKLPYIDFGTKPGNCDRESKIERYTPPKGFVYRSETETPNGSLVEQLNNRSNGNGKGGHTR